MSERKKETETEKRRKRFLKNETPYWAECLRCALSCTQTIAYGENPYRLETCPKRHAVEPRFPYAYKDRMEAWKNAKQGEKGNGKR